MAGSASSLGGTRVQNRHRAAR